MGSYATLSYTPDGQMSKIAYGDGEVATYTYDSRDRPTRIKDVYGSTVEMELNYTYDGAGNVLTENAQSYGYDALNRLTSASGPWGTVAYSYDQVGNRMKTVNGSTTTDYSYGPFNRLTSAGSVNYTYDANGNLMTKSGGWAYSYDYENRLTSVTHSGTVVQQDYYDGDGNRVEQVAGGSAILYSYQGVNILYQKNLTSDTTTKSFYAGGIQVAQMVGSGVFYLHQDALGSTVLTMTSTVATSFSVTYAPYGPSFGATRSEAFQYTGKLLDEATGLYYEGARYYDPVTGRFATEDSVVGSGEDPQSLNRYIYARDNPMKIVDMNGHEWWNPVADLTTAASDVAGAATDVANAASNAWNSLPPSEQQAIEVTAVVAIASAAVVVTAGLAAPVVVGALASGGVVTSTATVTGVIASAAAGAGMSAFASLGVGLYKGDANVKTVLSAASIGAVSGGVGALGGILANAAVGAGATFVDEQVSAYETTGHFAPLSLRSIAGVALGGAISSGGAFVGAAVGGEGGDIIAGAVVGTAVSTSASVATTVFTPIPQIINYHLEDVLTKF
ncbi:MAG: hypothetical protein JRM99_05635 [Nitrososphaerota archaeon]|nr:hypothetical protein [Nitrososphaerota archaeon]